MQPWEIDDAYRRNMRCAFEWGHRCALWQRKASLSKQFTNTSSNLIETPWKTVETKSVSL